MPFDFPLCRAYQFFKLVDDSTSEAMVDVFPSVGKGVWNFLILADGAKLLHVPRH